ALPGVAGPPRWWRLRLAPGALHGDCLTVTGRPLAENLADFADLAPGQRVLRPWGDPIKPTGHIQILRGSLAPDGAVAKITGKEGLSFTGPAAVFDGEEGMLAALEQGRIRLRMVDVIRNQGPQGWACHPELLTLTHT